MSDDLQKLRDLSPQHRFFVGIDSDGCVFDSMEIKHKECFTPEFIYHFGMQPVSRFARETWDFVNLYSKTRGCNRFLALLGVLDQLSRRDVVEARGVTPPRLEGLRKWTAAETKLGNAALEAAAKESQDPDLLKVLEWSNDVNRAVQRLVHGVPPFPGVRASLEKLHSQADMIVCSQTPTEALVREWDEHGIREFVHLIAGQELGTKAQHLEAAAVGKFEPHRCLMIGDAPGDMKAAKAHGFLFFPVVPGKEESSWERLHREAIDRFLAEDYAGAYEDALIEEFEASLPEKPAWDS